MNIRSDINNNNLHLNKIQNQIKDVEINRKAQQINYDKPVNEFAVAKCMDKSNFEKLRGQNVDSKRSTHSNTMRAGRGREIAEVMLRRVADENTFGKTDTKGPYQKTTPDYFRILEKPQNQVDPTSGKGFDGTMMIVSRNQGWITVTPKNKNRKKPVEKYGVSGDAAQTSKLTPNWMQCKHPKNKTDTMKAVIPVTSNLRAEQKRTYLVDRQAPPKSIWSIGDVRHNVHTAEQAQEFNNQAQSSNIVRLMDWKENPAQQRFDKKVTGKIGSYHG